MTCLKNSVTGGYPKNDLYKNGAVKSDHLNDIITQKFIAQLPQQCTLVGMLLLYKRT
jgi:hypothetical protein